MNFRSAPSPLASRQTTRVFDIHNHVDIHRKAVFLAASLARGWIAVQPSIAADEHDGAAKHAGRGKVISVDIQAGTVKLKHDPIKSLKWPTMTMDFKAHDPAMLKDLKPGAEVDFELMKMEGKYRLTKIAPSAN